MEKDWVVAKSFNKLYIANIAVEVLADNEIKAVIMNKKDSSYQTFGDIEVYVEYANLEKAQKLLEELN
jgi:hypothetical protein